MDGLTLFLTACFAIPILVVALEWILRPLDDAWFDRQGKSIDV